jgi:hypothetical protein
MRLVVGAGRRQFVADLRLVMLLLLAALLRLALHVQAYSSRDVLTSTRGGGRERAGLHRPHPSQSIQQLDRFILTILIRKKVFF